MTMIRVSGGAVWAAVTAEMPGAPTLVLVHGAAGSRLDWPSPLRRLPAARMITLDLAGHGRSTAPVRQSIAGHAADLLAVLDALELPSAVLVGHSMGGAVVQQAALDAPGQVLGLVLISTGPRLPVSPAVLEAARDPAVLAALLRRYLWGQHVPAAVQDAVAAQIAAADPAVLRADFTACAAFDIERRLSEITCPALVLCGRADRMTPPHLSDSLLNGIARSEACFFDGAGHYLQFERDTELTAQLARWLAGLSAR